MVSLGERKTIARYLMGEVCLDEALRYCERLIQLDSALKHPDYTPLVIAMYVLYARPFTKNKGLGTLPRKIVPGSLRQAHDLAIDFRSQLYAHTDMGSEATLRTRDGELFVKPCISKQGTDPTPGFLTVMPRRQGVEQFKELVLEVRKEVVSVRQKATVRYADEMKALPQGNYEVDLDSEGDVPIFKPVRFNPVKSE